MRTQFENYARTAAIFLLVVGCYFVLQPFVTALLFALVIAASTWPVYLQLRKRMGGRSTLTAIVMTLAFGLVVVMPIVFLAAGVANNAAAVVERMREWLETSSLVPGDWLKDMPVFGDQLYAYWHKLAASRDELVTFLKQFLEPVKDILLATGRGLGQGLLQMSIAVFVLFFLYRDGDALVAAARSSLDRVAGPIGGEVLETIEGTIVGVVYGILGTAFVQGVLAAIGFLIAGVPAALLLGALTFILSVVPVGPPLVWGGATIWLVNQDELGWAIFMAIYGFVVISGVDNVVKPLLISHGARLPFALVLLGVLGGIFAFGFIGIFLGPTLLAVGYSLLQWWLAPSHGIVTPAGMINVEREPGHDKK